MYVIVRLLKGFPQPLIYKVPASFDAPLTIGQVVEVPLKAYFKPAVVLKVCKNRPNVAYDIKEVHRVHAMPADDHFQAFAQTLARLYFTKPLHFYQRLRAFVSKDHEVVDAAPIVVPENKKAVTLTDEQATVVAAGKKAIAADAFIPMLLHGVTGSGKTEVYKALIADAFTRGKTTLFLCPEVSLARQFTAVLRAQLPEQIPVKGLHSASIKKEREAVWQLALAGQPGVIIGVHLPVLVPLSNLGLIVVDEEHEPGFTEKKHPRVNSKHAALLRARQYGVPVLLGSATPSVATLHTARAQNWQQFALTQRFAGAFPAIEQVSLAGNKKRPHFWISKELLAKLEDTLFRGQQAIIYLNRRGYSFFAQCKECGHIFECGNCAVSLTVHHQARVGGDAQQLKCHYCDYNGSVPSCCPGCKAPTHDVKHKGIGTQQVVSALQKLLPQARIARADTDVSRRKKEWSQMMDDFTAGDLDILVGTQIITKGYHFPKVTLVGVIWADSSVHFPTYDAHEVALQQLIQVAGRAGRVATSSTVVIQSFDDHEIFNFLDETKYLSFCEQELEVREELCYPPFGRMVTLEVSGGDEQRVARDANALAARLRQDAPINVRILGPASPVIAKMQRTHYRHIVCKAKNFAPLYELLEKVLPVDLKSHVNACPT